MMRLESFWRYLGLLVLSLALAFAAVAPPSAVPFSSVQVALAGDDDEEEEEDDDDEEDEEDDESQGRVVNGQVLGIFNPATGWAKAPGVSFDETTPPDMHALRVYQTGNQVVPVVLYHPQQIAEQGLKLGDQVSLDGEFVRGTFYATYLEITHRCC